MKPKSIFLHGFRATGKSTVGPLVAQKLGWEYVEMDEVIVQKAGQPVSHITKEGTDWYRFRQMEHDVLKELIPQKRLVVSIGGGTCVNNIAHKNGNKTFGELNKEIVSGTPETLSILLTASIDTIKKRMVRQEMKKSSTKRPVLHEQKAKQIQRLLEKKSLSAEEKKRTIVQAIVEDAVDMYKMRLPLYAAITTYVVDTGILSIEETLQEILEFV